jgi:thiamine-monophosphate kinase
VPIGDDAAVIAPAASRIMVTTDLMAEGVHFDLAYTSPSALGFKLVSVNVSDIMAMGARPRYLFLNLGLKADSDEVFFNQFYDGIQAACNLYGVLLTGGDMSGVRNDLFVSATVIGEGERYCTRRGAKPGDKIYVTGAPGESGCGLALLKLMNAAGHALIRSSIGVHADLPFPESIMAGKQELRWIHAEPLFRRHLMPTARTAELIAPHATAMIDVSDGLFIDLTRLCDESGVGAAIQLTQVPVSEPLRKGAACLGVDPLRYATGGGEDYELLFSAPSLSDALLAGAAGFPITCIGEITAHDRLVLGVDGATIPLEAKGYEHFA